MQLDQTTKPDKKEWEQMFYKQLGNYLRKRRLEYNIDNNLPLHIKEEQAKLLGLKENSLSLLETGKVKISLFDFLLLLGFYNQSVLPCNFKPKTIENLTQTINEDGISASLIYKFINNQLDRK